MEIIWIPIQLLKHPQELCILGKRSLNHCLYPDIKYLPKHVWSSFCISHHHVFRAQSMLVIYYPVFLLL